MNGSDKIEVSKVKDRASGQWREILSTLCGISPELLDGRHHPCPKCGGLDRFRAFADVADTGGVICGQCHNEDCGDGLSSVMWMNGIGFHKALELTAAHLGIVPHKSNGHPVDVLTQVAQQKRVSRESLLAYGATVEQGAVVLPTFDAAGNKLSPFRIKPGGGKAAKGLFQEGLRAGVFLPVIEGKPRLPQPGETWLIVEGPKDAAALHGLGCLALGMPTCQLNKKFVSLFSGVNVLFVPDRDAAGWKGSEKTMGLLFGVAESIRRAALPAEMKEKDGADVRDILAQADGEASLRAAIAAATVWQPKEPAEPEAESFDEAEEGQAADASAIATTTETKNGRPIIKFFSGESTVEDTLRQITDVLNKAGDCYMRTGQLVVLREGHLLTVTKATEMAGILSRYCEFAWADKGKLNCDPLPPKFANTWLNNYDELGRLSCINVFTRNPMYTQGYRLVPPGLDPESGIYYAGPPVTPKPENTDHLDLLLAEFCWKTPGDKTNYIGILLTALLMSKFIGSHPAALFNGNQPELGKSILAQIVAIIRTGETTTTCSYNSNDEEFEKSLGASIKQGATDIIVDNAKDGGRSATIDSAVLERSITDHVLNYRLLGTSSNIQCENSIQFLITANDVECSRDLVTRCCAINLFFEGDSKQRAFTMPDPEGYAQEHRLEILAELCGMVERWKAAKMPLAVTNSRFNKKGWGNVVGGILQACGEPDFLNNADELASDVDTLRREFGELVQAMFADQRGNMTGSEMVELAFRERILLKQLGDMSPKSQATRMGKLAGRFIGMTFDLDGGKQARFYRGETRGNKIYYVRDAEEEEADAT